jgi:hypothetical protein
MIQLKTIKPNPSNPRVIKDEKFAKLVASIKEFPQMLALRPIVVDEDNISLGGNMRLKALHELGYKEIPDEWVKKAADLTEEQKAEFIIKDNVGFGEWNWEQLANEWDSEKLVEWGLDLPGVNLDSEDFGEGFNLPDGDKAPFQQMTFTLADEQAVEVQNAIAEVKKTDEYKYMETAGNENTNGNALALIIQQWEGLRKL